MGQEKSDIGRLRHWREDRTPGRSEPTKGREMHAGCRDGDRKESSRAHTACHLDATPYGRERHTVGVQSTTMHRGHTGHVTYTRTGVCGGSTQSARDWSRERVGTLRGCRGQQQTMPQMHAQGCAGVAHRARRVERGQCKGHTGLNKSNHRGLDEVLRHSATTVSRGQNSYRCQRAS
ncbi:hypothetical protein V6N13_081256 [Hibiscus sabdariffa]|uniref:Uncharacterized protein n=1 Tax=Hibiscus sabdariffa TaxID=183260 RepID=A0ABR2P971_9ROSI